MVTTRAYSIVNAREYPVDVELVPWILRGADNGCEQYGNLVKVTGVGSE